MHLVREVSIYYGWMIREKFEGRIKRLKENYDNTKYYGSYMEADIRTVLE